MENQHRAALLIVGLFASVPTQTIAQQISPSEIYMGGSESEKQQLIELNRSNQANAAAMIEGLRTLSKTSSNNIFSPDISTSQMTQPVFHNNLIWSDNQGVWKLDKFGKQCAASATDNAGSEPCI